MAITFLIEEHGLPIHISSSYAPQTWRKKCEKDEFYESLELELYGIVVLAGDFNGHIWRDNDDLNCHGCSAYGTVNPESERIVDLEGANSVVVLNSLFRKNNEHSITYKSGGKQSQADYQLVSRSLRYYVTVRKLISGDRSATQHRLVVFYWTVAQWETSNCEFEGKVNWWRPKLKERKPLYNTNFAVSRKRNPETTTWDHLSAVIHESGKETLGKTNG